MYARTVSPLDAVIDAVAEFEQVMAGIQELNKLDAHDLVKDGFIELAKIDTAMAEIRGLGPLGQSNSLSRENITILLEGCRGMTASLNWNEVVNPIVQKCGISNQSPPLTDALVVASVCKFIPENRTIQISCGADNTWFLATLTHGVLGKSVCVRHQSEGKDTIRFGEAPEQVAIQTTDGI